MSLRSGVIECPRSLVRSRSPWSGVVLRSPFIRLPATMDYGPRTTDYGLTSVEPHVREEALGCEVSLRIQKVAFGNVDPAPVANQPGVGDHPALAYRAKIINFHLDRGEARVRIGSADYRKSNGSVDQGCDR